MDWENSAHEHSPGRPSNYVFTTTNSAKPFSSMQMEMSERQSCKGVTAIKEYSNKLDLIHLWSMFLHPHYLALIFSYSLASHLHSNQFPWQLGPRCVDVWHCVSYITCNYYIDLFVMYLCTLTDIHAVHLHGGSRCQFLQWSLRQSFQLLKILYKCSFGSVYCISY